MKKLIGYCAVDSGQIIIVDPCYVLNGKKDHDDKKYERVCTATDGGPNEFLASGIAGFGVATSTNTGDGSYPVYANMTKDNQVKSLTIEFDTW